MKSKHKYITAFLQASWRVITYSVITVFLACACYTTGLRASSQSDPSIFVPGIIPTSVLNSAAPAFTPDGNTVYFFQSSGGANVTIVFSQRSGDQWSDPKTAVFSGKYRDLEPAFAPDGKYLIFASNRPTTSNGALLDGHYNGQVFPGSGGNLWRVRLTKEGWQEPEWLPAQINSNSSVFSPAVAGDGSLYFMRAEDGGRFHIYRSQMRHGKYETPVLASFSDAEHGEYDPAVAADESYLIFSSGRPPAPPKTTDLFIVFRTANGWGEPIDLRSALSDNVHGIEARLSPDGKTLYYSNSRGPSGADVPNGRFIWRVDLTTLLKSHGAGQ